MLQFYTTRKHQKTIGKLLRDDKESKWEFIRKPL